MKSDLIVGRVNEQAANYSASSQSQTGVEVDLDSNTIILHFSDLQLEQTSHFKNVRIFLDSNQRDALLALLQESR